MSFDNTADNKWNDTNSNSLKQIRQSEKESHIKIYIENKLYDKGRWLSKPIRTILDIIPLFEGYKELRILDLGAGVGRNCIPFAQRYRDIDCRINCIDILELATQVLQENAKIYDVESSIYGITSTIENYEILPNEYDIIMAISALEHVESEDAFWKKIMEIRKGIRKNGIVCLVINSNVIERNKATGEELSPQFEVNLGTEELQVRLKDLFADWQNLKSTVVQQKYDIPRDERTVELVSDVVTFVAKNAQNTERNGSYETKDDSI